MATHTRTRKYPPILTFTFISHSIILPFLRSPSFIGVLPFVHEAFTQKYQYSWTPKQTLRKFSCAWLTRVIDSAFSKRAISHVPTFLTLLALRFPARDARRVLRVFALKILHSTKYYSYTFIFHPRRKQQRKNSSAKISIVALRGLNRKFFLTKTRKDYPTARRFDVT